MKSIIKRTACVILSLILVFTFIYFGYGAYFIYCAYMHEFEVEIENNGLQSVTEYYPLSEYVGVPSWFSVDEYIEKRNMLVLNYDPLDPNAPQRIWRGIPTYRPYYVEFEYHYFSFFREKSICRFEILERIYPHDGSDDFDRIDLLNQINWGSDKNKAFRSSFECALVHNGGGFERGEDYILFIPQGLTNMKKMVPQGIFPVAYFDGEYPRIIYHPFGIEIDATVMGAETKYVSKEEFIQLIYSAVEKDCLREEAGHLEVDYGNLNDIQ